jgi:superfamily II DNA or RNA helicase
VIARVRDFYASGGRRIVARIPTGGGKTFVSGEIIRGIPGNVVFMAHRRNLIDQTSRHLDREGLPHGIIAPGAPALRERVVVASVETLVRRLDRVDPPALIVTDECHHAVCGSYRRIYEWSPGAKHLGLTATPLRLDGQGLSDLYDEIAEGPTTAELIGRGFLSPYRAWAPPFPDVPIEELSDEELGALMDRPAITGDAVEHYGRLCPGAPALAFCATIDHAEHVAEAFRSAGWRARALHSSLDPILIDEYFRRLRDGGLDVLSNCGMIDEGTDVPGVAAVIDLAPSESLSRCLQRWGRALRPVYLEGAPTSTDAERIAAIARGPKPFAAILDHAGNIERHGAPDDPRAWSLDGKVVSPGRTLKRCPACYQMVGVGASACQYCGEVFARADRAGRGIPEVGAGRLEEVGGHSLLYDAIKSDGWSIVQARGIAATMGHRPELGERVYWEVFGRIV